MQRREPRWALPLVTVIYLKQLHGDTQSLYPTLKVLWGHVGQICMQGASWCGHRDTSRSQHGHRHYPLKGQAKR